MAGEGKSGSLGSFLFGIVVGAVGWILLAPRELKDKAEDIASDVRDKASTLADEAKEKASVVKENAMYMAEGVGGALSEYAQEGKTLAWEKKDVLSEKLSKAVEAGKSAFAKKKDELNEQKGKQN